MIYTVTFNPSLDYIVKLQDLKPGHLNRTQGGAIYPGGKGINVSIVLKNLGIDSKALGFIAGFTGQEIQRLVGDFGCNTDFIPIGGDNSRINVKIMAKEETEINGQGPLFIRKEEIQLLINRLHELKAGDILILAGSVPATLPADIYESIIKALPHTDIRVVADTTGELLLNILKYRPFLIKPSLYELSDLFGKALCSRDEIIRYGKRLQELGACNVLISMGKEGAVLIDENQHIHQSLPPEGHVLNSVGAGDSMVAGFLAGFLKDGDFGYAFRMALCAGSASAFCEWLAKKEDIMRLMNGEGAQSNSASISF